MAATYDPLLPTDRDRLRFRLGDTDVPDNALVSDEQYDAMIAASGWRIAGAELAEGLAARFAQEPDSVSIGGTISVSWRSMIARWIGVAAQLRAEAAAATSAAGNGFRSFAPSRFDRDEAEYVREGCWR